MSVIRHMMVGYGAGRAYRYKIQDAPNPPYGLDFQFPVVKLNDWRRKWKTLEQTRNPFGMIVQIHLEFRQTVDDGTERVCRHKGMGFNSLV